MRDTMLYGYRLRPRQVEVLSYTGGFAAVSAVPGSGKTLTLSLLAARLIVEGRIGNQGEVLVVTVQNSAVDNIGQRIRGILAEQGLPPVGFRVCTLHKLAADILRQRLDLAGVEEGFAIIDEVEARRAMHNAADVWISRHRAWWLSFLDNGDGQVSGTVEERWRQETERVGREVTKLAKHLRLTPEAAQRLLLGSGIQDDFTAMGLDLYAQYARYLQVRTGLDFDDLIWRALDMLDQDPSFVENLRARWPYILEDEAQDSSPLQERILERLAGPAGNWIRVGDPNQSINSTFTAADPRYFRRFFGRDDVTSVTLPQSGRSGTPIIDLANRLVRWVRAAHPEPAIRDMAFMGQDIQPTDPGDAQPNPPAEECHIHVVDRPYPSVDVEAGKVALWAASYAGRYPERTVAILVPSGWQGGVVVDALQQMPGEIPFDDLLRSTPETRSAARVMAAVTRYLGAPTRRRALARLFAALHQEGILGMELLAERLRLVRAVLDSIAPHELLFPHEATVVEELLPAQVALYTNEVDLVERFARLVGRWVRAASLPVDQLLLTVAQDLYQSEPDLAICHSLATSLRGASEMHPNWGLTDFAAELDEVAGNRRALGGLSLADVGYTARPGRIVVTTMHKAKGLEWDAVYLMCIDNLEFPDTCDDAFRDEPYFMPGRAPAVEARKQLAALGGETLGDEADRSPVEQARLEVIAERLRLLYVGITRARRDLAITYSEMNGRRRVGASVALMALVSGVAQATNA
ncbi:MAG TPA: ATP-dependent helicase [Chloroflexi bacterium]|nr:ATP-dependent helicase [Chloroflexota bacterium]